MLALALGGRSVEQWQETIGEDEFASWTAFFELFPFDDFHRFHRPAALIAQAMAGGSMQDRLAILAPEASVDPLPAGMTHADAATMRAFGFKPSDLKG